MFRVCWGLEMMPFFKETCSWTETPYSTVMLLCLSLYVIPLPSGCVFWAAPLIRDWELNWFTHTLFLHSHRRHNNVSHALWDVWPRFRAWAVATEQSKAEWPHIGSEPLTVAPWFCLQNNSAKCKLPFCLCMSNMFQKKKKRFSPLTPKLLPWKEFFASCAAPCSQRAAKFTTAWRTAYSNVFQSKDRAVVVTDALSRTRVK